VGVIVGVGETVCEGVFVGVGVADGVIVGGIFVAVSVVV
jgi:hypothetical protein